MKTLNEFLTGNKTGIKEIIRRLGAEFNSHDFIRKFSKKYEADYISYLAEHVAKKDRGAFKSVHGIIAKHLSTNSNELGIKKNDRVKSENIFGELELIQNWKRL